MNRATKSDSWVQNPDGTLGWTCNIFTGCKMGAVHPWCFAMKLANGRLKQRYLENTNFNWDYPSLGYEPYFDPFYPRFWADRLEKLDKFLTKSQKPVGVFLNIMGEAFGDWIPRAWQDAQFEVINKHPRHRFYLLTHQPQNLINFSPFPENCSVGVTTNNTREALGACLQLGDIEAGIRFLSIEPMLASINIPPEHLKVCKIGWIINGAMTGTKSLIMKMHKKYPELTAMPYGKLWTLQPKIEWVGEVVRAADKAGIPVFLKDNLKPLFGSDCDEYWVGGIRIVKNGQLRQEMPE